MKDAFLGEETHNFITSLWHEMKKSKKCAAVEKVIHWT